MNALLIDRDEMLRTIAQHIVDGKYNYDGTEDLQRLISNKIGHEISDPKELKSIEKHIKEIRTGR